MARYDDPREIAQLMKQLKTMKLSSMRSPYTGMLTLMTYTLWKDYKFKVQELSDFCQEFLNYDCEWQDKDIAELSTRLSNYTGWTVDYEPYKLEDFAKSKSKVYMDALKKKIEYDNYINELSTKYFIYGFNILIDTGFSKKKLSNYKDKVNKRLAETSADDADTYVSIMEYWQELFDKTGIYIEKPRLTE